MKDLLNVKGAQKLSNEDQKAIVGGDSISVDAGCAITGGPSPFGDGTTPCCPGGGRQITMSNGMLAACSRSHSGWFWYW
ncbi:hypothetical protein [Winogradskyella sp.]|uniref:hypothetical protein n=1 Tax=Winogradskyella sp. TaxID=1883156 RepID=UPI003BA8E3E7